MSSALILGDVHLGKSQAFGKNSIGSQLNTKLDEQLKLLDWTLDQAIDDHIENIIITGDIFEDPKPAPSIITQFVSWLKKCQLNNIHIHHFQR